MKETLKKAEQFIKEAQAFGLEPNIFNVLNFLDIQYKWNADEKKIEVDKKDKMLLEFIKMMLNKYFPKTQKETEDSPM